MRDFAATWEDLERSVLAELAKATAQPAQEDRHVRGALYDLVGVASRRGSERVDPGHLPGFVAESTSALLRLLPAVRLFVSETVWLAEEARDDDWYQLCLRRSALQLLMDDYQDVAAAVALPSELPHIDEEMRRVGSDWGPVSAELLLQLPTNHWWWLYPSRDT